MQSQTVVCERNEHLVYRCIKCGCYWDTNGYNKEELKELILQNKIGVSSGYCPECLRGQAVSKIRKSQKQNGYPSCYLKAEESCDQTACCYRSSCLEEEVDKWRDLVVLRNSYIEDKEKS